MCVGGAGRGKQIRNRYELTLGVPLCNRPCPCALQAKPAPSPGFLGALVH